jgi:hypothetical protein
MPITIPRKVVPIAEAQPAQPAPAAIDIAAGLIEQGATNAAAMREVGQTIAQALASSPTPLVWNFKVTYDHEGRITNIKATGNP